MYAVKLPPELVTRLWRLRELHRLGPIRRQVLIAVEHYVADMEAEYGTGEEAPVRPDSPAGTDPASSLRRRR